MRDKTARSGAPLWRRVVVAAATTALVVTGAACSSDDGSDELHVFAAASLRDSFTEIERYFEDVHTDVDVVLTFDGSSALVNQIEQGARADVVATADEPTMARLEGRIGDPRVFATNTLVIITAPGNPKGINGFSDLTREGLSVVVCSEPVPCGTATAAVQAQTGVELSPVSEETSVSGVSAKVVSGQADAGIVYVSDARAAGDRVETVTDEVFAEVVNSYPIAVLEDSSNPEKAAMFVGMVTGETGASVLEQAGFGAWRPELELPDIPVPQPN